MAATLTSDEKARIQQQLDSGFFTPIGDSVFDTSGQAAAPATYTPEPVQAERYWQDDAGVGSGGYTYDTASGLVWSQRSADAGAGQGGWVTRAEMYAIDPVAQAQESAYGYFSPDDGTQAYGSNVAQPMAAPGMERGDEQPEWLTDRALDILDYIGEDYTADAAASKVDARAGGTVPQYWTPPEEVAAPQVSPVAAADDTREWAATLWDKASAGGQPDIFAANLKRLGYSDAAIAAFAGVRYAEGSNPGGGYYYPDADSIVLRGPQDEAFLHETAHAWWDIGLGGTFGGADELAANYLRDLKRVAAEDASAYRRASQFAREYLRMIEAGEMPVGEAHGSLFSAVMGDTTSLPDYMMPYYGMVKPREGPRNLDPYTEPVGQPEAPPWPERLGVRAIGEDDESGPAFVSGMEYEGGYWFNDAGDAWDPDLRRWLPRQEASTEAFTPSPRGFGFDEPSQDAELGYDDPRAVPRHDPTYGVVFDDPVSGATWVPDRGWMRDGQFYNPETDTFGSREAVFGEGARGFGFGDPSEDAAIGNTGRTFDPTVDPYVDPKDDRRIKLSDGTFVTDEVIREFQTRDTPRRSWGETLAPFFSGEAFTATEWDPFFDKFLPKPLATVIADTASQVVNPLSLLSLGGTAGKAGIAAAIKGAVATVGAVGFSEAVDETIKATGNEDAWWATPAYIGSVLAGGFAGGMGADKVARRLGDDAAEASATAATRSARAAVADAGQKETWFTPEYRAELPLALEPPRVTDFTPAATSPAVPVSSPSPGGAPNLPGRSTGPAIIKNAPVRVGNGEYTVVSEPVDGRVRIRDINTGQQRTVDVAAIAPTARTLDELSVPELLAKAQDPDLVVVTPDEAKAIQKAIDAARPVREKAVDDLTETQVVARDALEHYRDELPARIGGAPRETWETYDEAGRVFTPEPQGAAKLDPVTPPKAPKAAPKANVPGVGDRVDAPSGEKVVTEVGGETVKGKKGLVRAKPPGADSKAARYVPAREATPAKVAPSDMTLDELLEETKRRGITTASQRQPGHILASQAAREADYGGTLVRDRSSKLKAGDAVYDPRNGKEYTVVRHNADDKVVVRDAAGGELTRARAVLQPGSAPEGSIAPDADKLREKLVEAITVHQEAAEKGALRDANRPSGYSKAVVTAATDASAAGRETIIAKLEASIAKVQADIAAKNDAMLARPANQAAEYKPTGEAFATSMGPQAGPGSAFVQSLTAPPPRTQRGTEKVARKTGSAAKGTLREGAALWRGIVPSHDISYPLRQGYVIAASHPLSLVKGYANAMRVLRTGESKASDIMDMLTATERDGLFMSNIPRKGTKASLNTTEEQFTSKILNALPWARRLEQANVVALNTMRAHAYDSMANARMMQGADPDALKAIATFVNHASGRGTFINEATSNALSHVLFSPRWAASRFQVFTDLPWLMITQPKVGMMAARDMAAVLGSGVAALTLLKLAGVEVNANRLSTNFGRFREPTSGTWVSIWGGLDQPVRLAAQLWEGKRVTGGGTEVEQNATEALFTYFRQKASPIAGPVLTNIERNVFHSDKYDYSASNKNLNALLDKVPGGKYLGLAMPIIFQNAIENFATMGWRATIPTALEFLGQSTSGGYDDYARLDKWIAANKEKFGGKDTFKELSPAEKLQAKEESGIVPEPFTELAKAAEAKRVEVTTKQSASDSKLLEYDLDGKGWRDAYYKRLIELSAFKEAVYRHSKSLPGKDEILDGYYAKMDELTAAGTQELDFDAYDEYLSGLDDETLRYIMDNTGLSIRTDVVKEFRAARRDLRLNGWYDLQKDAWAEWVAEHPEDGIYPDLYAWRDAQRIAGVLKLEAEGVDPRLRYVEANENIDDYPSKAYDERFKAMRLDWVTRNTELAKEAVRFGYLNPAKGKEEEVIGLGAKEDAKEVTGTAKATTTAAAKNPLTGRSAPPSDPVPDDAPRPSNPREGMYWDANGSYKGGGYWYDPATGEKWTASRGAWGP